MAGAAHRARGWKVQSCEMQPQQRDRVGDNLNMGQRVRLKLRKNNSGDWFDYDHVVLVMLHELCHNDIGPHNAKFFKLPTITVEQTRPRELAEAARGSTRRSETGAQGRLGWNRDARSAVAAAEAARRAGYQVAMDPRGQKTGRGGRRATAGPEGGGAAAAERRLSAERFAREHGLMNDVVVIDDEDDGGGHGDGAVEGESGRRRGTAARVDVARCPRCDAFRARGTTARWCRRVRPREPGRGKRKRARGDE